jgi:glucan phosphoethanolaminetransferase (alkaline phosphatase superfamily)
MSSSQVETTRDRINISCVVGLLAALTCALVVLNVAELQSAVMIIVRAHVPEATGRPVLDVGLPFLAASTIAPLLVLVIAVVKRWSLPRYLAWIIATVMFVFIVSALAAFAAYRYWREHQAVAQLISTTRPLRPPTPHQVAAHHSVER